MTTEQKLEAILEVLRSYGCLEWADGPEAEEMAPYFEAFKNKIREVIA